MLPRLHPALILAILLLTAWEGYVRAADVSPLVLPGPSGVLRALFSDRQAIAWHGMATLGVAVLGFGCSAGFAFATSVLLHFRPWLARGLIPIFVISQTVPIVALAPLMILWFGFGLLPKVLLVILVTFFPILLSLLSGYAGVPRDFIDLLRSMGARPWLVFRRATLAAARISFFTGLRISATYAIVATIFAEYAGARRGLGIYILTAKNSFRADLVLAAVVLSAALTLALLALLGAIDEVTSRGRRRRDA